MFKTHMPEPEVLAMLSHSQEFEQVKVSLFECAILIVFIKSGSYFQFKSLSCLWRGQEKLQKTSHLPGVILRTLNSSLIGVTVEI